MDLVTRFGIFLYLSFLIIQNPFRNYRLQIQLLIFIKHHSKNKATVSYLAKEFNLTKATISDTIKILKQKKYITKTINANDESRPNECPVNDLGSWRMSVYPPPERMLCLPVTDEYGRSRKVIAECVICIMEYEIGDQVVWSTSRLCQHAFHTDCILAWLSKAKKRCPICRYP